MRIWDSVYMAGLQQDVCRTASDLTGERNSFFRSASILQQTPVDGVPVRELPFLVERKNSRMDRFMVKFELLDPVELHADAHVVHNDCEWIGLQCALTAAMQDLYSLDGIVSEMIASCVGTVRMLRSEGHDGGSVSAALGYLYLAPKPHWTPLYWAEMLAHEATHNALFLVDMTEGLFPDLAGLKAQPTYAESALRGERRPFDKAFHSAFVALTVGRINRLGGNPGRAASVFARVEPTIKALRTAVETSRRLRHNVMSDVAIEMIDELEVLAKSEGELL